MEKKERMRIKGITMILSCLLLFAGCGENGGSEEKVSTETAGQKVSEENSFCSVCTGSSTNSIPASA